jgi:hypothetical protein
VVLVFIDLLILPMVVLWVFVGSILTTQGAPFLASSFVFVAIGAGLIALTVVTGRAWHRAPRPNSN